MMVLEAIFCILLAAYCVYLTICAILGLNRLLELHIDKMHNEIEHRRKLKDG